MANNKPAGNTGDGKSDKPAAEPSDKPAVDQNKAGDKPAEGGDELAKLRAELESTKVKLATAERELSETQESVKAAAGRAMLAGTVDGRTLLTESLPPAKQPLAKTYDVDIVDPEKGALAVRCVCMDKCSARGLCVTHLAVSQFSKFAFTLLEGKEAA